MINRLTTVVFSLTLIAFTLGACVPAPEYAPTPTKTPLAQFNVGTDQMVISTPLIQFTETPEPSTIPTESIATPTLTAATAPSTGTLSYSQTASLDDYPTPVAQPDDLPADHYILSRPIPEEYTSYLDRTYPYGGTSGGRLRPHTGVEFFNPEGTPVIAAANAVVEYAGVDEVVTFGPSQYFYGNLIVLRVADSTHNGQPIFLLYGHLSVIGVEQGQSVTAGQEIGKVGGTGAANGGAHLHFEVRIGDDTSYTSSTRNPDLWIRPYNGYGTLAGRVVGESGHYLPNVSITIRIEGWVRYTWSYAGTENIPDEQWGENFTYGDLPVGVYSVTFSANGKTYREQVEIKNGQTSWLQFTVSGS